MYCSVQIRPSLRKITHVEEEEKKFKTGLQTMIYGAYVFDNGIQFPPFRDKHQINSIWYLW